MSELSHKDVYQAAVDPLTAAAIVGGIASLASSLFGHSQNKQMNDKNIQMQRETNHLNYMMNQQNNAFNAAQAVKMFNLENEYNDPKNQMARLKAAGINPFVAAGGSNIGQVEGRADTIPAQQPIPFQAPQYKFDQGIDLGTTMSQFASAIASLAQAKKNVGDDKRADATIDTIIEQMKSDIELKNEQRIQISWQNAMNYKYGDQEAQKKLRNLDSDWAKAQQDMTESEARTWLTQIQADIADIERETKDAELKAVLPYLGKMAEQKYENLKKEGRVLDTQALNNVASANASNAAAEKDRAVAETERQLRRFKVALIDNQNTEQFHKAGIARKDYEKSVATYQQAVDRADYENQLVLLTIDQVSEQVGLLLKDNKYYEVKMLLDASSQMINSLSKLK